MLDSSFCLGDAQPEIFNSDRGAHFATRLGTIDVHSQKGQARPIDLRKTFTELTILLFREI